MTGPFGRIVALLSLLLLAACGSTTESATETTAAISTDTAYALSAGDKVRIKVFGEPDLTGDFQIDETGRVAFPLIGDIHASGLTLDEFKQQIISSLKNGYVRNPRLTVDILNYRPINIIGEVKQAGQYPYRPGISAQDIAAIAGGYSYRANQSTLYVLRGRRKQPITVELDEDHFPIMPGDTVKVPERIF